MPAGPPLYMYTVVVATDMGSFVQVNMYDNGSLLTGTINIEITDITKLKRLAALSSSGTLTKSFHLLEDDSTDYRNLSGATAKVICIIDSQSTGPTLKIGGHGTADTAPTTVDWDQSNGLVSSSSFVTTRMFTIEDGDYLNVENVTGTSIVYAIVIEES